MLSASLGCGYTGAWFGAGRALKHGIRHDLLIDRVVANLYVAACLDRADYELSGSFKAEEVRQALGDSAELSRRAAEDFSGTLERLGTGQAGGRTQRWLLRLAGMATARAAGLEALRGVDPRVLFALFSSGENVGEYLRQHPEADSAVAALTTAFGAIRECACGLVDDLTLPHAALGALIGLGGPPALLGLFRLVVWLVLRRRAARSPGAGGAGT